MHGARAKQFIKTKQNPHENQTSPLCNIFGCAKKYYTVFVYFGKVQSFMLKIAV